MCIRDSCCGYIPEGSCGHVQTDRGLCNGARRWRTGRFWAPVAVCAALDVYKRQHMWQAVISSRATGKNCPYCTGRRPVPGQNDLLTTHPQLASQWHPTKNGKLTPRDVSKCSGRKVDVYKRQQGCFAGTADAPGETDCIFGADGQAVSGGMNHALSMA